MNAHAIRAGEQFIDRTVACAVALFNLRRKAMPLRVDDAHLQGRGPQRQLASDLSQPDDPELLAVKCLEFGDARPIAVGRVFALVSRRRLARRAHLLLAYQVGILSALS